MITALTWTGIGTLAATFLIGIGVWMARSGQSSSASSPTPEAELKIQSPTPSASSTPPRATIAAPVAPARSPAPAPAPALAPATPAGPDALVNGSIEATDVDDGLDGWFIHDRFKPQAQILTESGNRFLRLTNTDPAKTVFADQRIKIEPTWKALNVSARMRATNFKSGRLAAQDARVAFAFRDEKDVRIGNWPPVPSVKTDSPWVERTVTVDVPEGAKSMYIQLAIFNATGTVDFDDVKVVPAK
jgi:hypothetical protein